MFQLSVSRPVFLYRPIAETAWRKPVHRSSLSGRLPSVAPFRIRAPRTRAVRTAGGGLRCSFLGEVPRKPRTHARQLCADAEQSAGGFARVFSVRSCQGTGIINTVAGRILFNRELG